MIYNDGLPMDENLRVTQCPKCGNEEFSRDADFCRICGTSLYNVCDGEDIYDYHGNYEGHENHKNLGNARFCEKCGKPTYFFNSGFLLPFDQVRDQLTVKYLQEVPGAIAEEDPFSNDYDEMPFK